LYLLGTLGSLPLAVAGVLFVQLVGSFIPSPIGWLIWFVVILAVIYLAIRSRRCPACDRPLGRDWSLTYCPHCAVQLQGRDY
jgi:hypothetical protein